MIDKQIRTINTRKRSKRLCGVLDGNIHFESHEIAEVPSLVFILCCLSKCLIKESVDFISLFLEISDLNSIAYCETAL